MQTQSGFTSMTISEFEGWIAATSVTRTIRTIQQHHTWAPNYAHFTGSNHFILQRNMKHHHVANNGWSDIGQHFTIFPDGTVMTGRPLNTAPACIFGNNAGGVCIESLGNFDTGGDQMATSQRDAIIGVTRALLARFSGIPHDDTGIVYHHWFNLSTGARNNGSGGNKSCPGTAFFGGNKVADFRAHFLPLVTGGAAPATAASATPPGGFAMVNTAALNVRSGPGTGHAKITEHGPLSFGAVLRVFARQSGWLRVANSKSHWVWGNLTLPLRAAQVTADCEGLAGPGAGHPVLTSHVAGETVHALHESGAWVQLATQDWVPAAALAFS